MKFEELRKQEWAKQRQALFEAAAIGCPVAVHYSVWREAYEAGEIGRTYSPVHGCDVPVLLAKGKLH